MASQGERRGADDERESARAEARERGAHFGRPPPKRHPPMHAHTSTTSRPGNSAPQGSPALQRGHCRSQP
jgi:hypothetical protein